MIVYKLSVVCMSVRDACVMRLNDINASGTSTSPCRVKAARSDVIELN